MIDGSIRETALRALVHPLTHDALADHTSLGRWIGTPVDLHRAVLDPPGINQRLARFGKTDFESRRRCSRRGHVGPSRRVPAARAITG